MEKKIYFGGGLGLQILVMGGRGEFTSDELVDIERVELPAMLSGPGIMIQNDFEPIYPKGDGLLPTPWHDDHANRKERRRMKPKTKVRFR